MESQPIGIFDSGIGGLTVARQLANILPSENLIYFGDTAHLPYGDKSTASIQAYAIKICNFLLTREVKAILIACNSASAAAFELVKEYVGTKAQVFNVIDPVVDFVCKTYPQKTIGLIGTKQTVNSRVFERKIYDRQVGITLKSLATPLLAPMIEEGFYHNKISWNVIENYLLNPHLENIEALILACTHYPLIAPQIKEYYGGKVDIIDSSLIVARSVKRKLAKLELLAPDHPPEHHFFVSDYTEAFENSTQLFFSDKINLEFYPLWE